MSETYTITQIETQKHDQDRVNIHLDGAFAFGLEREVAVRHGLHEGDVLTEEMIDDILLLEERTRAKEKALSFLSRRDLSVEELRKKLREKRFSERVIDRVVGDLERVGLLDDLRFAFTYAGSRLRIRPMGKRLLRQELLLKGIAEPVAEEAIEAAYDERSEEDLCRRLAAKKMEQLTDRSRRSKRKLAEFLQRRGFDWDTIYSVLPEALWRGET